MKKLMLYAVLLTCLMAFPIGVQAYSISDSPTDAIGAEFEGYGIDVLNYHPGTAAFGTIGFDIYTDYPQSGITVGGWATTPADLFIYENYYGVDYLWAIPLVSHGSFSVGTMYAVDSYKISDDFDPSPGSYIYNHNVPVQIGTLGSNYGHSSIGSISVGWNPLAAPGHPDWQIHIATNLYQDDPNGTWDVLWGTATCGNDVISAPEPATMLLLGFGLVGIGLLRRRSA